VKWIDRVLEVALESVPKALAEDEAIKEPLKTETDAPHLGGAIKH